MKHSKPDIAHEIWKLSMVMNGANLAPFFKMHHIFKYVFDTMNLGLTTEPKRNENEPDIVCFSNSDYGGNPVMTKV